MISVSLKRLRAFSWRWRRGGHPKKKRAGKKIFCLSFLLSARSLTLSFNGAVSLKFSISVNSLPWEYWIVILSSYLRAQGGQRGKKDHHGTSCPEFSGLVGPCFLCGDFFPCKADPRHSDGPLPRERHDLLYLRSVLWFCLVGGLLMFFGALLGFRYV